MALRGGCHGADGPRAPGIATACHNASCRRVVNPSSHAQGPNTTPGPAGGWTQMLDVRIRTLCFKAACTTSFSFHHKSQQESFHPAGAGPRRWEGNSDAWESPCGPRVGSASAWCHLVSRGVSGPGEHRAGARGPCDATQRGSTCSCAGPLGGTKLPPREGVGRGA